MRFSLFSYRKQIEELKEEVERLKKANAQGFEMVPTFHRDLFPERSGVLTWKQLWDIYRKSSAVRISVDMIAREIASLDWEVVPKERVRELPGDYPAEYVIVRISLNSQMLTENLSRQF